MLQKLREIRILPRWIIILIDALLVLIVTSFSYLLRFNFDLVAVDRSHYELGIPTFVILSVFISLITQSYSGIVRYTGFQDGLRVAYTLGIASIIAAFINYIHYSYYGFSFLPNSINLISFFISVVILLSYRLVVKFIFEFFRGARTSYRRILIFGAGDSGQMVNQLFANDSAYKVIGYLEDDPNKIGKVVNGLKIFKGSRLDSLIDAHNIDELIISVQFLEIAR